MAKNRRNTKLSDDDVLKMRHLYHDEGWSQPRLARHFCMSEGQVQRIVTGVARQNLGGLEKATGISVFDAIGEDIVRRREFAQQQWDEWQGMAEEMKQRAIAYGTKPPEPPGSFAQDVQPPATLVKPKWLLDAERNDAIETAAREARVYEKLQPTTVTGGTLIDGLLKEDDK